MDDEPSAEGWSRPADRFVVDGHRRARDGCEAAVRTEVEQESADELRQASIFGRMRIRRRIEREIERRICNLAPPDALY